MKMDMLTKQIQAAIEGLGVALGRGPLVADALRDGRLVRPFREITQSPFSYWLNWSTQPTSFHRHAKQERGTTLLDSIHK